MPQNEQLIGLSLPRCVKDIYSKKVPVGNVGKIISATDYENADDVIALMGNRTWKDSPEAAATLVRRLCEEGLIEQPKNAGATGAPIQAHGIEKGIWLDVKLGQQFSFGKSGERIYADTLDEGVAAILAEARQTAVAGLREKLGLTVRAGSREPS